MCQHTDGRLARVQFDRQARLVAVGQPEVLVVKRAGGCAAEDADPQDRRARQEEDPADRGALAGAACADLVLLELPLGIEGQDPDCVAVGDAGVLQRVRGVVGGGFIPGRRRVRAVDRPSVIPSGRV
jgi:hypothetical protein